MFQDAKLFIGIEGVKIASMIFKDVEFQYVCLDEQTDMYTAALPNGIILKRDDLTDLCAAIYEEMTAKESLGATLERRYSKDKYAKWIDSL